MLKNATALGGMNERKLTKGNIKPKSKCPK